MRWLSKHRNFDAWEALGERSKLQVSTSMQASTDIHTQKVNVKTQKDDPTYLKTPKTRSGGIAQG